MTLRIVFAGTPAFAVPALRALAASGHPVVGVLTQPDRPSGRGRKLTPGAVKQAALELGLPVAQPLTLKTDEGRAPLLDWKPDLMVVVAYGLILPPPALTVPRFGCVNIHASLLPRWRGAAPIQRAILAGDEETGATIMQMDAGLDTGAMLLQRRTAIGPRETSADLHVRLADLGASAVVEALGIIASGSASPQPQPNEGVTYAAKIEKAEGLIDWSRDAAAIDRQVRAFDPWPGTETRFAGESLRILKARVADTDFGPDAADSAEIDPSLNQSGLIASLQQDAMRVRCGRGWLQVEQVQRPGKRPILAREFVAACNALGHRLG